LGFNSFGFLAFFGITVVVYYAIAPRARWALLLAASLYFYAALDAAFVPLLAGVALVAFGGGLAVRRLGGRRRRGVLAVSIAAVLAPLVVAKYRGLFMQSSGAAAGLSFYTFSCVSYLADVHAGRLEPERHLGRFGVYVSFFPKLLAGPLERAKPFLDQLAGRIAFNAAGVTAGLQLMLWGLFKKVVIADRLAPLVDAAYRQPAFASPADLVIATYLFAFQIYCDFSGYSDIAIGAARVLGIDLMENFRRPYFSTSIREFWSARWHVSLMAWFRDYLYIPLGGSRVSRLRRYLNVMAVFLVSGLWHGASWTFVAWGALNGLYVVGSLIARGDGTRRSTFEGAAQRAWRLLCGLGTFHLVLVGWVFFRARSLADAALILSRVARSLPSLPPLLRARLIGGEMPLTLALIAVLLAIEALDEGRPFWQRISERPVFVRWPIYYGLLVALIVLGKWNLQQFVYMQF
jgi:alginate O-acetyltransferase complex protein AlgI